MTTDLEKKFFDTFGIEPKTNREYGYKMAIYNEAGTEEIKFYPQITDHILLELICLLSAYFSLEQENWFRKCTSIKELKDWVLKAFIEVEKRSLSIIPRYQVQALFKE